MSIEWIFALVILAAICALGALGFGIYDHFTLHKKVEKLAEEKVEEVLANRRQKLYDHGRRVPARDSDKPPGKVHKAKIRGRLIRPGERNSGFSDPTSRQ